jgi:hypothetical protein
MICNTDCAETVHMSLTDDIFIFVLITRLTRKSFHAEKIKRQIKVPFI